MTSNRAVYGTLAEHLLTPPLQPLGPRELRRYLILSALLSETVVVSDAVYNNNPCLRALTIASEGPIGSIPTDLHSLLRGGHLKVAYRSNVEGPVELQRRQHLAPGTVPTLPSRQEAEWLERVLPESARLRFKVDDVARMFHENLLGVFSTERPWSLIRVPQDTARALYRLVRDWDAGHINAAAILDWLNAGAPGASHKVSDQVRRHHDHVWSVVKDNYRFNVPKVLGLATDLPIAAEPEWLPLVRAELAERIALPFTSLTLPTPEFVHPTIIDNVALEALDHVRGTGSLNRPVEFKRVLELLDASERGQPWPPEKAQAAFAEYFALVDEVFRDHCAPSVLNRTDLARIRADTRVGRAFLRYGKEVASSVVGFFLAVPTLTWQVFFATLRLFHDLRSTELPYAPSSRLVGRSDDEDSPGERD